MATAASPSRDASGQDAHAQQQANTSQLLPEPEAQASENTPLLGGSADGTDVEASDRDTRRDHSAASLLRSFQNPGKGARRWPSLVALLLLCVVVVLIMVLGFFAPATVEEYAMQATTFEPTSLSIDSFTATGVRARIQGDFRMDASRVKKKSVRDFGRFGTWIAREVESGESKVAVSLPEYGNVLLGTAQVPSIKVDIRNGHTTHVDFVSDVQPGDFDGLRRIAKDWVDGRLGQLRVLGQATVPVKSGIFSLGKQTITQTLLFANDDLPSIPSYKIHKLNFHDADLPETQKGMAADVSLEIENDYPVDVTIPPLGFAIFVDGCSGNGPQIQLADATTDNIHVRPKHDLALNVSGIVRQLPKAFTQACPGSHESPLDVLLRGYMKGNETTIYVRGSDSPSLDTPKWITDIMSVITVPLPFPGHTFGHLIRNFTLADVHFGLPDPFADPNAPESNPTISANIKALIALPEEMNFNLDVSRVKADADVYYKGDKLGKLRLDKWQHANTTRVPARGQNGPTLLVQSLIQKAPLEITDDDVFTDVVQAMLFGGKSVMLSIRADVDVEIETALGQLAVRKIPAEGKVPVKPVKRDSSVDALRPKVGNLQIIDTTRDSLTIDALVNFTNPTNYSATVPYIDLHLLTNGTLLGHATAKGLSVKPGLNINLPVTAVWNPFGSGGDKARAVGVNFLSQYLSGYNTTLTIRAHEASVPSQPALGRALSKFEFEFPTPRLGSTPPGRGGDGDVDDPEDPSKDKRPHFISDTTMHLITSSATFILHSPLKTSTLYITYINATAVYKDDDVGHIEYDQVFAVPPAVPIMTPRLPVDWSLGSVGYEAVKGALGGSLKLAAKATVGVRIGRWQETIWFEGKGIGAKVRL